MKKVVLCGFDKTGRLEGMLTRAFEALGHSVTLVSQSVDKHPLIGRFGVGSDDMRDRIVSECADANPEIVLVIKGYDLKRETIQRIRSQTNAVVANWNPDNPFQVRSKPTLAEIHLKSLSAYDIVFTWGKFLMDRLREHGAQRVEHLPFGYDPSLHRPMDSKSTYECDVAFLGHWSKKRERVLSNVAGLNIDFGLWGNYWKWRCWKPFLRRYLRGDALMGESYARAMSSAKIGLNVVADHNMPAYNMRTFEIPATRSFMLTTDTSGQRDIFKPGRDAAMYADGDELEELITYYLDNDKEREAVAAQGHQRVKDHSYRQRMKRVLEVINS